MTDWKLPPPTSANLYTHLFKILLFKSMGFNYTFMPERTKLSKLAFHEGPACRAGNPIATVTSVVGTTLIHQPQRG